MKYPRHSLLSFEKNGYFHAISASWNFDAGSNNRMIGIREVYSKLGKEGQIEELINTPENASCQCKIIRWYQPNKATEKCYLKNSSLDSINDSTLRNLIDERSILLKDPEEGLILIKK